MEKYIESGYVDVDYVVGNISSDVFKSRIEMDVVETSTTIEYRFNILNSITLTPIRLKYSTDVILSDGKVITIPDSMSEYTYTIDKVTKIDCVEFETSTAITNVDATFIEFNGKKIELKETDEGEYIVKDVEVTLYSMPMSLGENSVITLTSGEKIFLKKTEVHNSVKSEKGEIPKLLTVKTKDQVNGKELVIKPKNSVSNTIIIDKETAFGLTPQNIYHSNNGEESIAEMNVGDGTLIFEKTLGNGKTYYTLDNSLISNRLKSFNDLKNKFTFREFE